MTSRRLLLALALVALVALPAMALPNFTGTWKMNSSKSDFGPMPPPSSAVSEVKHDEPNLSVHMKQSSDMGEFDTTSTYTTDGKECSNKFMDSTMKSTVKWDGNVLVIDSKGDFGGNEFTLKARWTLAEDGKTITINQHMVSPMGELDMKMVMEKQ